MTRYYFNKDVGQDYTNSLKKARLLCIKAMKRNPKIDYIKISTSENGIYLWDDSLETITESNGRFIITQSTDINKRFYQSFLINKDGSKGRRI